MNLDDQTREALRQLSEAINSSLEKSVDVRNAIERVQALGIEPKLPLRIEIAARKPSTEDEGTSLPETEFTDEDLQTLRRMKIRL